MPKAELAVQRAEECLIEARMGLRICCFVSLGLRAYIGIMEKNMEATI